jgi:hypothetical protein
MAKVYILGCFDNLHVEIFSRSEKKVSLPLLHIRRVLTGYLISSGFIDLMVIGGAL